MAHKLLSSIFILFLTENICQAQDIGNSLNKSGCSNNLPRNNIGFGKNFGNGLTNNFPKDKTLSEFTNNRIANGISDSGNAIGLNVAGMPISNFLPVGSGDISLNGELPVGGTTAINGNLPVIGYVTFEGHIPAHGSVSVATGSCKS